jgi:NAD-dependent deacetylase
MIDDQLIAVFDQAIRGTPRKKKKITFLTGAGVSAESGVPTYRGTDGYWRVGSSNFRPEEIGTYRFFASYPYQVWQFTLYRKGLFQRAQPNAGHEVIARLESVLGDRFHLNTQNIDRLHHRAGNSEKKTYEIPGNLEKMRCGRSCSLDLYPIPDIVQPKSAGEEISEAEWQALKCPKCGYFTRPNILWFDEKYNERLFKLYSALKIAKETGLLLIVGTSGATNLPNQLVAQTLQYGGAILDINIEENHFSELAQKKKNGYFIQGKSSVVLPAIESTLKQLLEEAN